MVVHSFSRTTKNIFSSAHSRSFFEQIQFSQIQMVFEVVNKNNHKCVTLASYAFVGEPAITP